MLLGMRASVAASVHARTTRAPRGMQPMAPVPQELRHVCQGTRRWQDAVSRNPRLQSDIACLWQGPQGRGRRACLRMHGLRKRGPTLCPGRTSNCLLVGSHAGHWKTLVRVKASHGTSLPGPRHSALASIIDAASTACTASTACACPSGPSRSARHSTRAVTLNVGSSATAGDVQLTVTCATTLLITCADLSHTLATCRVNSMTLRRTLHSRGHVARHLDVCAFTMLSQNQTGPPEFILSLHAFQHTHALMRASGRWHVPPLN